MPLGGYFVTELFINSIVSSFLFVSFASSSHFCNKDLLKLAVEDFNICQSIHQNELKQLERCLSFSTFRDLG